MNFDSVIRDQLILNALLLGLVIAFISPQVSGSVEYGFDLEYGLDYSDNIRLVPENKEKDLIQITTGGFSLLQQSARLNTRVTSTLRYEDYRDDVFTDRSVLDLNAESIWVILPEGLLWTAEDSFQQTLIDSLSSFTPANSQDVNIFSTGPDYILRLGSVNRLEFGARYAKYSYEVSDIDNKRISGNVRWLYKPSQSKELSLNYEPEDVDYKNDIANRNYTRSNSFFRVQTRLSRNSLILDLGNTKIKRDRLPDFDDELVRFSWRHVITSDSEFALSFASEPTDVGQQLSLADETTIPGTLDTPLNADVFIQQRGDFVYSQNTGTGSNVVGLFWSEDDYELSPNDRERTGADFNIGYNFSATYASGIFGNVGKTEYLNIDRLDRDKIVGIGFVYRHTPRILFSLEGRFNVRESTGIDGGGDYREKRAIFSVSYNRRTRFSRVLGIGR